MSRTNDVIFVEDDEVLREGNVQGLELAGFDVAAFADARLALSRLDAGFAGVVVSDVRMPGMDGLEFFEHIRGIDADIPVVLITGHGDIGMAVDAMQRGAHDFVAKPFGMERLAGAVRSALRVRARVLEDRRIEQAGQAEGDDLPLIGAAPATRQLRQVIRKLAAMDVDVLILGETGTGKDVIARALHRLGSRASRPMVTVACAAIPEAAFDTEMFGHEAGQVISGQRRTLGRIERADRGTLFLDGLQSLAPSLQAKLLRVVEEREIWPIGAAQPRHVDIRIIATADADLPDAVRDGAFRADLYYRLHGITLNALPLRDRREDIPVLFGRFLAEAASRFNREPPRLTEAVRHHLLAHHWPGNVRELSHFAERVAIGLGPEDDESPTDAAGGHGQGLAALVDRHEATLIRDVLRAHAGDARGAMAELKLPRKTFYAKLNRHGIRIDAYRGGAGSG